MIAYLAWLSRGVPVGAGNALPGADGLPALPHLTGNRQSGAEVYAKYCVACHQDTVHEMLPASTGGEVASCIHCHADVGHGPQK